MSDKPAGVVVRRLTEEERTARVHALDQNRAERADKRKKFVELAEKRTRNAIRAIRIISKLGNKSAYAYDDADVRKIAAALTREIENLKNRMSSPGGKEAIEFTL